MTTEYKKQLKTLRKAIRGHVSEVAEACGVSVHTVYSVLNGVFDNQKVIEKALEVRDRLEIEKRYRIEKTINRISA
jgi:tRNA G26 N,N-dimethylase Trm1